MIRFGLGLAGLIIVASATDTVNLWAVALAAVPCVLLLLHALRDIAE